MSQAAQYRRLSKSRRAASVPVIWANVRLSVFSALFMFFLKMAPVIVLKPVSFLSLYKHYIWSKYLWFLKGILKSVPSLHPFPRVTFCNRTMRSTPHQSQSAVSLWVNPTRTSSSIISWAAPFPLSVEFDPIMGMWWQSGILDISADSKRNLQRAAEVTAQQRNRGSEKFRRRNKKVSENWDPKTLTLQNRMYKVSHIGCSTARHEKGCAACPQREQGKATLRRLAAVKTR
jgi:hypothetical protein